MKKLILTYPAIVVGFYFAIIITLATYLTSCGVHYTHHDSYGNINKKTGVGYQIMTPAIAKKMEEEK